MLCRTHLIVILLCLPITQVMGEVPVSKQNVVLNRPPGMCTWCALETMGRHLNIERLNGLSEQMTDPARRNNSKKTSDAIDELDRRKVRYDVQWPEADEPWYRVSVECSGQWYVGRYYRTQKSARNRAAEYRQKYDNVAVDKLLMQRTKFIKSACDDGLCVAASVDPTPPDSDRHIIVVTHFDPSQNEVRFIDSNVTNRNSQTRSLTWFLHRYNGFALVVFPDPIKRARPISRRGLDEGN